VREKVHLGRLSGFNLVQSVPMANVVLDPYQKNKKIDVFLKVIHLVADFLNEPSSGVFISI